MEVKMVRDEEKLKQCCLGNISWVIHLPSNLTGPAEVPH